MITLKHNYSSGLICCLLITDMRCNAVCHVVSGGPQVMHMCLDTLRELSLYLTCVLIGIVMFVLFGNKISINQCLLHVCCWYATLRKLSKLLVPTRSNHVCISDSLNLVDVISGDTCVKTRVKVIQHINDLHRAAFR